MTATFEWGNSSLGYVKSDLRSTMREDRLNALMLLFVHKGIPPDHDKVIDKSATIPGACSWWILSPVTEHSSIIHISWSYIFQSSQSHISIIHISIINISWSYISQSYIADSSLDLDLDLLPRLTRPYLQMLCTYNACFRGRYPTSERPRSLSRQNDLGRYLARTTLRHNV